MQSNRKLLAVDPQARTHAGISRRPQLIQQVPGLDDETVSLLSVSEHTTARFTVGCCASHTPPCTPGDTHLSLSLSSICSSRSARLR
jgi:hypothetical protein